MGELQQTRIGTPNQIERAGGDRSLARWRKGAGQRLLAKIEHRYEMIAAAQTAALDFFITRSHETLVRAVFAISYLPV